MGEHFFSVAENSLCDCKKELYPFHTSSEFIGLISGSVPGVQALQEQDVALWRGAATACKCDAFYFTLWPDAPARAGCPSSLASLGLSHPRHASRYLDKVTPLPATQALRLHVCQGASRIFFPQTRFIFNFFFRTRSGHSRLSSLFLIRTSQTCSSRSRCSSEVRVHKIHLWKLLVVVQTLLKMIFLCLIWL